MRYEFISLTPWILTFTLAAGCTPGSTGETATTGSTGADTGGATSTSTGTSDDPTTTEGPGTSTTEEPGTSTTEEPGTSTTEEPGTTTAGDPTETDSSPGSSTEDDTTTTTGGPDPVEENCQGLEFPPEAPAMVESARWTGPMSIRLTDAEKFLCGDVSPDSFGTSCNSGFLVNAEFPGPIVPGQYVDGEDITMEGVSAVWDRECANGGYGGFVPGGTVTIYAVSETCIAGAILDPEDGVEGRFLAPKCP
ncbi:hypothetical protein [Nannocystis punicea]|uniref:Uncharacterized protein n=1 Tax=Nannocystis punicea TaxID=2995304 RepID=A0ABY7GX11_9BACT|nr:hypothetical protein [Nannocystis poenicansa]WAS91492.1 hypothetical protein O0S08_35360 [Nannocystis poenicansa]